MVSFNERYGPSRPKDLLQAFYGEERIMEVLKQETHEYVVECFRPEGQMVNIGLTKGDVFDPLIRDAQFCFVKGFRGDINGDKFRAGTVFCEYCGLGTNPACSLEHPAPWRIAGIIVEQIR